MEFLFRRFRDTLAISGIGKRWSNGRLEPARWHGKEGLESLASGSYEGLGDPKYAWARNVGFDRTINDATTELEGRTQGERDSPDKKSLVSLPLPTKEYC